VLLDAKGTIRHKLDTGVRSRPLAANLWWANGLARYSPNGRFHVTWEMAPVVHVWDANTGQRLHDLRHEERIEAVDYDPGSTLLRTSGRDAQVRIWGLADGKLVVPPLRHPRIVGAARFLSDGRQVMSASEDGVLRVWDWRSGQLLAGHQQFKSLFVDFALTSNQRTLIATGVDRTLVFEMGNGAWLAPPLPSSRGINLRVVVPRDDSRAIVSGFSGALVGHDLRDLLTPSTRTVEEIVLRAEVASGLRVHQTGSLVPLTADERAQRLDRLSRDYPLSIGTNPAPTHR
jgi:WD40 repeat protein